MPVATPDISGMKFGILTAIRMVGRNPRGNALWECECECGNLTTQAAASLKQPGMRSCGCMVRKRPYTKLFKHGKTKSPEFSAWSAIIYRCHNPAAKPYKWYGARGIVVCDRWRESFPDFLADVGEKPEGKFSLDRIDNDKGYEPGNVKWSTGVEQNRNRRNVRMLTHDGITMNIPEWAVKLGISNTILTKRIRNGWTTERTLTTPAGHSRQPK